MSFLILLARLLVGADPRKLAGAVRKVGGIVALAAAGFLLMRGALPLAIPLAVFGLALVGRSSGLGLGGAFGSAKKSPGQASRVRTDRLEMELDHDSGRMDGQVLAGRFNGRALSSLSDTETFELLDELQAQGAQEVALVEAYLDWRLPGWRDQGEADKEKAEPPRGRARSSKLSVEEAYAVLGIDQGASEDDIRQAHRRLMMKMHPDQGGSTYLAARINEAKDVLLGRKVSWMGERLLGAHHHAIDRHLLQSIAYALRIAPGEAGEAGAVPLSIVLGEGGGEGQMAVEQVGGALLDHAEPVLGFRFRRIGADLDVEGAADFRLGSLFRLRLARRQAGVVGSDGSAISPWASSFGVPTVDGSGTAEAIAKLGFFSFAGDGVT